MNNTKEELLECYKYRVQLSSNCGSDNGRKAPLNLGDGIMGNLLREERFLWLTKPKNEKSLSWVKDKASRWNVDFENQMREKTKWWKF